MCGRFTFTQIEGIPERFNLDEPVELNPRYNIAPTQNVPVIVNNGKNRLSLFRWGLIPFWAKDIAIGNKMINARAETPQEKPSFKTLLHRKRCLILADGFYEWKQEGTVKKPHWISLKHGEVFAFAGLWDRWVSSTKETINSCTIITTSPNDLMKPLHNRMPVILPVNSESVWLDETINDPEQLIPLLRPYPSDLMKSYEVSTIVNSPKNDFPDCVIQM